ncbi:probable protein phosphatase 2C 27 [Arachis duranensis]|uniref:protein-serine/threonine phosphatase n=1 Tax=Arachis duranensis TaxID=130453 RepID=A0A6P4BWS2_ARADU|nr:probable protein phosphatase 2C 27 [Arachis duranensis]XP_015932394.1 probable protein phosphatase 2C 27 [Arachis duranensis]
MTAAATMCVEEAEQVEHHDHQDMENTKKEDMIHNKKWPLHCDNHNLLMDTTSSFASSTANSLPLESICEETVIADKKQNGSSFVPALRSGEWSDIGGRPYMEDTHICIGDMAKRFGYNNNLLSEEAVSFYGVFDGHGGKSAAQFVRDHLPRIIVEDAGFPLELEKVVTKSFLDTDAELKTYSLESCLSSGTTALTAIIFGRSLLVANAGDCRAVLSRHGAAIEMSKDHRPYCIKERNRIESLGGFIDDGYLNGQLGVTRALGDWHLEGMKDTGGGGGPLSAEPELKLMTLTKEDEFLIIASDGIWDVFRSQNAVDYARRRLQEHNDVKQCCKQIVEEAIKRGATDNLTVVMVCFHSDPPPPVVVERARVRRSISAEGLHNLKCLLQG